MWTALLVGASVRIGLMMDLLRVLAWITTVVRENENSVALPLMLTAEYFICRLLDVASVSM